MAPLTWRNVAAPNGGGAAALFAGAAQSLQGGVNMFSNGLENFQDRRAQGRSNSILAELGQVEGEAGVNSFLSSVAGRIGGQDITPELAGALANLRGTALGYDTTRTNTRLAVNADGRAAGRYGMEVDDRNRRINQEDQLAALAPELLRMRENAYGTGLTGIQTAGRAGDYRGQAEMLRGAVIQQESGGNPNAVSPVGATGIMQLMPDTAANPGFGVRNIFEIAESMGVDVGSRSSADAERLMRNADVNATMGTEYLTAMLERYNGDVPRALAAYNWGAGRADNWDGNIASLPEETQGYLRNIMGNVGQGEPRLSSVVGEDNAIPADVLLGLVDDNYDARRTGIDDRRTDRQEEYDFGRGVLGDQRADAAFARGEAERIETERVEGEAQAARELALAALRNNATVEEAQRELANNPDLDERELAAAMARLGSLAEDGSAVITTPEADLTGERLADLDSASVVDDALATVTAETNFDLTSNDLVRINRRAEEVVGDTDPVQYLRDAIPGLQDNPGQVAAILNRVAQQNEISPAQAAVLLEETIRNRNGVGRVFRDWSGSDRLLDEDAASALAGEVFSPAAIRDAALVRQNAERDVGELSAIRDQISQIDARLNLTRGQGSPDDPQLIQRRAALIEQAQRFQRTAAPAQGDAPPAPVQRDPAPAQANPDRVGNVSIQQVQTFSAIVEQYPSAAAVLQSEAPPAQKIQVIDRLIDVVEGDIFLTNAQRQERIEALRAVRSNFQN